MKCNNCGGMSFVEEFVIKNIKLGHWCLVCRSAALIAMEITNGSTGMSDVQLKQVRVLLDDLGFPTR